jgi:hypothetical protein
MNRADRERYVEEPAFVVNFLESTLRYIFLKERSCAEGLLSRVGELEMSHVRRDASRY